MKLIRTKFLRLIGRKYITMPWAIYAAPLAIILEDDFNHEAIHQRHWKALLIFFPVWYAVEGFVKLLMYTLKWIIAGCKKDLFSWKEIYRSISFEREAYANDSNHNYLEQSGTFDFLKYVFVKEESHLLN